MSQRASIKSKDQRPLVITHQGKSAAVLWESRLRGIDAQNGILEDIRLARINWRRAKVYLIMPRLNLCRQGAQ
jgi:hypothetical protein